MLMTFSYEPFHFVVMVDGWTWVQRGLDKSYDLCKSRIPTE